MASAGGSLFLPFQVEREINHHDRVFLHDADQQNDADERDHAEFRPGNQQGENGAGSRRRQRRENRDGMDVAFVKDAEDDVHRDNRRENEPGLVRQRGKERLRRSLKRRLHAQRQVQFPLRAFDGLRRFAERHAGREIERNGHRRKLALMIHRQRRDAGFKMGERAQRHRAAGRRAHVDVIQLRRIALKIRQRFQNDVILVQLGEEGGNLPLAERVVERVVNRLRRDAQAATP